MAGYCTLVLYFHSPVARENTDAHSRNIQPYCLLSHQIIYMYYNVHWPNLEGRGGNLIPVICTCIMMYIGLILREERGTLFQLYVHVL